MPSRRLEPLLIAGSCAIVFFAQAAAFNDVRLDDAYVTFRYAQNLANGTGFVFNPGEHVLGTMSPGQALVGALFYSLVGKIAFPAVMAAMGCAGWTAQAACVFALLRERLGRGGAAFVALGIAAGAARSYFWVPLETHLVAALVLASFAFASRGRWIACGIAGGLSALVRGDALLACAALGVGAFAEERTRAWRPLAAFAIVVGAWAAFALAYFGTLVPHPVHAKVAQTSVALYAQHAISYPALSFAPWSRVADAGTRGSWLTVVPVWALSVGGAVALARPGPGSRVRAAFAAYGVLVLLAYVAVHPNTSFGWHLYPVTLVLAVCALSAIALAAKRIAIPRFVAAPLASALVVAFAIEAGVFSRREPWLPTFGARDSLAHTVAAYLAAAAAPTDYVDAAEVGAVGYLSGLPMVDHPGAVSDDATGQLLEAVRGRPSRVRWAILSREESQTVKATFAPFHRMVFQEDHLELSVYDLRFEDR